ncbi:MAG: hypothetical protein K6A38_08755 [Lachnospiraceae bacterium]|nr:hypothetical protein [Lachnospiraceae bacterium]
MNKRFKKVLCALLAGLVLLPGILSVDTVAANDSATTVYVSEKDPFYHTQNCSCLGTNKIAVTLEFAATSGFTACTKCNPPLSTSAANTTAVTKQTAPANNSTANVYNYVLNKNTKKFHYPNCSSVKAMKEKNKIYFTGTREEVIAKNYDPCKNCKP